MKAIVIDPLLSILPFKAVLDWTSFQTFCTDILFNRYGITDARDYLGQGSLQDGIDCYATGGPDGRLISAQCKLENYLSPKDLDDLVDLFMAGDFAGKSHEFILCTNFDLGRHRDHEQQLQAIRDKLAQIGVAFIVWDEKGLSTELRNHPAPHLVSRYFGLDIAAAFYGEVYQAWFRSVRRLDKPGYPLDPNYIPRKLVTYQDHRQSADHPAHLFLNKRHLELTTLIARNSRAGKRHFLVMSTAGYGKTIELEHAAAWFAQGNQYLFPVKSYLSDYEGQPVAELLNLHQPNWRDLQDDALLLILDGLDEIREEHWQTFINHLNQFTQARPKTSIVVSTRFNFYDLVMQPLRGFEILILQPFNQADIDEYLKRNIPQQANVFRAKIKASRFQEFVESPYYLARLVRFFHGSPEDFPATRAQLFEHILFERFDADNRKKGDRVRRAVYFKLAQQIAYAMTRLGRSSLSGVEMSELINDPAQLKLIQHFFLLNKHASAQDAWSFEHKNLQEYLCAKILESLPMADLRELVTYPYDRTKVQPRFVNMLSFLFLIADTKGPLFQGLLQWLTSEQEELLVRFEKDRILPAARLEVFKKILARYRQQNKALHASSSFSLEELMDFISLDSAMIAYLQSEMLTDAGGWYAYNGADVLGCCGKPYLYAGQLKTLFYELLVGDFDDHVKINALHALGRLEITDQLFFERIFALPLNLDLPDIRQPLIQLLNGKPFLEHYLEFLIGTLAFFEHQENHMNLLGSAQFLKQVLLLQVKRPASLRRLLVYALTDPDALSLEDRSDVRIDATEFKELLEKASAAFPDDAELVELVYQFYDRARAITIYAEWLSPVLEFFRQNGGLSTQFYRAYREDPAKREVMPLAEEATCDFLIAEYKQRRISQAQMVIYRNVLSHVNPPLFEYFYQALLGEFQQEFHIPDKDFNYQAHWDSYTQKNQAMLLDKALYLQEIAAIFTTLGLTMITKHDLHDYSDYKLRAFQQSIVLQLLRRESDAVPRDEHYFAGLIATEEEWTLYKIDAFYRLYDQKTPLVERYIHPELRAFAVNWLHEKVAELDFTHTVTDGPGGQIGFNRNVEFVCRLYLRVQPEMTADELLKMLPADFRGGLDNSQTSIASIIVARVDPDRLLNAVMEYLQMNLATYVQKTLFGICQQMHYTECLPMLYHFIRENQFLTGSARCNLTAQYLALGGDIDDFADMLAPPPYTIPDNDISWEWFLLDKFMKTQPDAVVSLMLDVLADTSRTFYHQMTAAHNLITMGRIEGLRFWSERTLQQLASPFQNIIDPIVPHILEMDPGAVLDILLLTMAPFVAPEARLERRRSRELISEFIADLLLMIVKAYPATYPRIIAEMNILIGAEQDAKALYWLKRYRDEITQAYHVVSHPEPTIAIIRQELAQLSE
ncbi:NACHT domain-containing protein [Mucilaginibacter psychrotolerans]|uniref:NACHT domain-containing protein n=1 Tax=Mucilaginibacter psychrotolerans TaxID=1524096 RepID=A0A4Y8SG97_9SPHI|nr:hypothetical protein [Mucilaginibacter psychrotolerans]TFF37711.1 hypothetical protein E2R66_11120 [Mucilaginibacter psychrotolerans]